MALVRKIYYVDPEHANHIAKVAKDLSKKSKSIVTESSIVRALLKEYLYTQKA